MTHPAPLPVIFIAGMGRSGSTLLDRLLGSVDGVCSVGELRWIWTLGFRDNQLCGCGERFLACPFWVAVVAEAFGGPGGVEPGAMARRQEALLRLKWLPFVLAGRLPSGKLRYALRDFGNTRRRLYRAILTVSGATTVVDSSKYPPYGVALRAVRGLDVRTVHLVRDARGTAHSVARQRDPSAEGRSAYRHARPAPLAALNWLTLNVVTEAAWLARRNYLRVRYEDLAADPEGETGRILRFAGIAAAPPRPLAPATFDLGVQHTLAGNPMRMEHGPMVVRPDLSWRTGLSSRSQFATTAITLPGLLRYGYRL